MRLLALAFVVVLAACGRGNGEPRAVIETGSGEPRAVIETGSGEAVVNVEIADSAAERERGLMGRPHLAVDAGMVFLFPKDTDDAFWMKDTLIPLSIAFYDDRGRIGRILDMVPCEKDPCPTYSPGVSYRGALEVNLGAFARWGVREGDVLRLER